jgi:NTP pyrophosphatase (non-canonical NTP hydrolase)
MTLDEYQNEAAKTDKQKGKTEEGLIVPLLGLAGETGSLLTLYKKWMRDGDAYQVLSSRIAEELGDVLWYVATIAGKAGLSLSEIGDLNLKKTKARWLEQKGLGRFFDEGFPKGEQLPRKFVAEVRDFQEGNKRKTELVIDGEQAGDHLTDNAYSDDGYRLHDVFHLSYAAMLGWSPVLRANLERKRKSDKLVDEVEDGGRAIAIEEGIAALVFTYAKEHSFFENVSVVDWGILRTCHDMAAHLEVSQRSLYEWEQAILAGYRVWRAIRANGGGFIQCDLASRVFEYSERSGN